MKMTIPYLQKRNGWYYYRRRVPEHLIPHFGKKEHKKSLGIRVEERAKALAEVERKNREIEALEKAAEWAIRNKKDPQVILEAAKDFALKFGFIGPDTWGLGDGGARSYSAYDLYTEKLHDEAQKRVGAHREPELSDLDPVDRMVVELVKAGGELEVPLTLAAGLAAYVTHKRGGKLSNTDQTAFKHFEEWIEKSKIKPGFKVGDPFNLKDLTRAHVRQHIQWLVDTKPQGASTIKRRINVLKAMWNYANNHFDVEDPKNPWAGAKVPDSVALQRPSESRLPFTQVHLRAIERGLLVNSVDPEVKLAVRALRCTGARPAEIAGLRGSDIVKDKDGVWLRIDFHSQRRLKNSNSKRRVPIVDPEVAYGLLALAEGKHDEPVFQKGFQNTNNFSQRLNGFLRNKCKLPRSPRLVAYSFRHTVIEALRVSETPYDVLQAIVGHSDGSVTQHYGAGSVSMSRMREALEAAMSVLGEVDTYNYRPEELILTDQVKGETA